MPVQCFCNDDIQKLVVEILDRHHYLTVVEAEVFDEHLESLLKTGVRRVTVRLQGREYGVTSEDVKKLQSALATAREEAERRYGRPAPAVNVEEKLARAQRENESLKVELAKAYAAKQEPVKGKGKL